MYSMKNITEEYDVVVCGGGLAGFCAAVSAARHGAKTCIIQDRPVFGGNSSSEIRVKPLGADRYHVYGRETGIISELLIKERAINHSELFTDNGVMNSVWDMILYDVAVTTPNLTFHLNTRVMDVQVNENKEITEVIGYVSGAENKIIIKGKIFMDCTGDGVVAAMCDCEWRIGEEARDEFNESHAPIEKSEYTMGNSLHFTTKNMGEEVPFTPPDWAVKYDDADFFYKTGRTPYNQKGGYWWIEIGKPWHTIYDNEQIRHELTAHLLGIWDWVKNKDPRLKEAAKNWALDWVGQVPGKRESRRIMGQYLMTEHDIVNNPDFDDEIAYGGFFVDLHSIGGLRAEISEPTNAASAIGKGQKDKVSVASYVPPYGIPLRILLSKDIKNLMMAGRNISATHVALGTLRVMSTTSLMGQAAGIAAAVALKHGISIQDTPEKAAKEIQQLLLRDGCFLPHKKNEDPLDLARKATVSAASSAKSHGIGPNNNNWVNKWFKHDSIPVKLEQRMSQWIAVGNNRIDKLSVCLNNETDTEQKVKATLMPVEHIWDYNSKAGVAPLAETVLSVKPGKQIWVDWDIQLTVEDGLPVQKYVRLDLYENPNISWQSAGTVLPGQPCAYEISEGRLRKYNRSMTMSFKVEPEQKVYEPANVLSGVTRPHKFTNLWRSDPEIPLPVWFELKWDEPQTIGEIQITFAGNFIFEYGAYKPLFKDGDVAKDYNISAWIDGKWVVVEEVSGNYQCRCRHTLNSQITTDKIRINIFSTNGDLSAGIYEIRCY